MMWPDDVHYDDVQLCKINISQDFKEDRVKVIYFNFI